MFLDVILPVIAVVAGVVASWLIVRSNGEKVPDGVKGASITGGWVDEIQQFPTPAGITYDSLSEQEYADLSRGVDPYAPAADDLAPMKLSTGGVWDKDPFRDATAKRLFRTADVIRHAREANFCNQTSICTVCLNGATVGTDYSGCDHAPCWCGYPPEPLSA